MTPPLRRTALRGERIPVVVLGGSGYVAGEVVRLLAGHPGFALAAVVSESRAGAPLDEAFPHLAGTVNGLAFAASDSLAGVFTGIAAGAERCALVSAAPHGASAALVARALALAEAAGVALSVVDLSADFRFAAAAEYAAVYGHPHPAPELLARFVRALPEHAGPKADADRALLDLKMRRGNMQPQDLFENGKTLQTYIESFQPPKR